MLCSLKSATLVGIEGVIVDTEVDVSTGLPAFNLVGLGNNAVREGGVRVRSALGNNGFDFKSARTTVNLAPANLRKEGSGFDLPIALAAVASKGMAKAVRVDLLYVGELALDGNTRAIRGTLALAEAAKRAGLSGIVVPRSNAAEAALVEDIEVFGVESLVAAIEVLEGKGGSGRVYRLGGSSKSNGLPKFSRDFSEVIGQPAARRGAEVAAAGGHNLMMIGSPGSGKTMIAQRIPSILPALSRTEAIESTKVHSAAGTLNGYGLLTSPPFRAPHHTCSPAGLIGGGSSPRPGELSLAHNGVLFLDELPEFQKPALESLRQPLEDEHIIVVRAKEALSFPTRSMVVAAMNPCPCGYRGSEIRTCICGDMHARRYRGRISGPMLDRFDIFVQVEPVDTERLLDGDVAESSAEIKARVVRARESQRKRFEGTGISCNAQMEGRQMKKFIRLRAATKKLIKEFSDRHQLSSRALHRSFQVARTIADLAQEEEVREDDIFLALSMQQARWAF
jgi:magnesium chelatase family protein